MESLPAKVNILLTHHHLRRNPFVEDANSVMVGGELLVEALKGSGRQWLVIHGHLHVPMLSYADADPFTPIILSSASVAAKTFPVQGKHPRNQIHHIEIDPALNIETQQLLGVVTSFTWSYEVGWQRSSSEELVPYKAGFGYRPNTFEAAERLVQVVKAGCQPMRWEKVLESCPNFRFMTPRDLEGVLASSRQKGLAVDSGAYGLPSMLE